MRFQLISKHFCEKKKGEIKAIGQQRQYDALHNGVSGLKLLLLLLLWLLQLHTHTQHTVRYNMNKKKHKVAFVHPRAAVSSTVAAAAFAAAAA